MTAPYDIDPKSEQWTQDEMKLRYEGGWSVEYSAATMGNVGFNRYFHNRLTTEYVVGTNPAPSNNGVEISGGVVWIWQKVLSTTPVKIDDSIDWRDRRLWFEGTIIGDQSGDNLDWYLPGGPFDGDGVTWWDKQNVKYIFSDPGAKNYIGHVLSDIWTGPGHDTLGTNRMTLIQEDNAGSQTIVYLGSKTNGELFMKLNSAPTTGAMLIGKLTYSPQWGDRDT